MELVESTFSNRPLLSEVCSHAVVDPLSYTVHSQITPRGRICKNDFSGGGLFEGTTYSRGFISKFGVFFKG